MKKKFVVKFVIVVVVKRQEGDFDGRRSVAHNLASVRFNNVPMRTELETNYYSRLIIRQTRENA